MVSKYDSKINIRKQHPILNKRLFPRDDSGKYTVQQVAM